jgi:hypothetical protein
MRDIKEAARRIFWPFDLAAFGGFAQFNRPYLAPACHSVCAESAIPIPSKCNAAMSGVATMFLEYSAVQCGANGARLSQWGAEKCPTAARQWFGVNSGQVRAAAHGNVSYVSGPARDFVCPLSRSRATLVAISQSAWCFRVL